MRLVAKIFVILALLLLTVTAEMYASTDELKLITLFVGNIAIIACTFLNITEPKGD